MRDVGQSEPLVAVQADVSRVVGIGFLVVNRLVARVTRSDLVLHAKVECEDPLIVDLKQHRVGKLVTNLLAQGQSRAGKSEEFSLRHMIAILHDQTIVKRLQSRIHRERDRNLLSKEELHLILVGTDLL